MIAGRRRASFSAAFLALAGALVVGCGDGKIRRYPVTGKVLVGGQPLADARLTLRPIGGSEEFQKQRPLGVTREDGSFELTTFVKGDGAPAGEYTVRLLGASARSMAKSDSGPRFHPKYGKHDTSGLTATIEPGENVLEPFDLEPAPPRRRRR